MTLFRSWAVAILVCLVQPKRQVEVGHLDPAGPCSMGLVLQGSRSCRRPIKMLVISTTQRRSHRETMYHEMSFLSCLLAVIFSHNISHLLSLLTSHDASHKILLNVLRLLNLLEVMAHNIPNFCGSLKPPPAMKEVIGFIPYVQSGCRKSGSPMPRREFFALGCRPERVHGLSIEGRYDNELEFFDELGAAAQVGVSEDQFRRTQRFLFYVLSSRRKYG